MTKDLGPIVSVPIETLFLEAPGFTNPRTDSDLGEESILELASDIERRGLRHPLIVWEVSDDCRVVISGQRRLLAIQRLEWSAAPVRVYRGETLDDARAEALADNIVRSQLSTYEVAAALAELPGSLTEVAAKVGMSASNASILLTAWHGAKPKLKEKWRRGEVSSRAVYDLVRDPGDGEEGERSPGRAPRDPSEPAPKARVRRPPTSMIRRLAARAQKQREKEGEAEEYLVGLADALNFAARSEEPDDERWMKFTGRRRKRG